MYEKGRHTEEHKLGELQVRCGRWKGEQGQLKKPCVPHLGVGFQFIVCLLDDFQKASDIIINS